MPPPTDANVDFLVCDAVRQEVDGKLTVTGYYPTAEIKLAPTVPLPVALNLTFVFVLKDGDGPFRAVFRIADPLGRELHKFNIPEFRKPAGQAHVLMLPVNRIPIGNSGNFVIVLDVNGQVYRRTVRIFQ